MSIAKELKERAALALQALRNGNQAEAERLLEADAKGFMPGPPKDLTNSWEVSKLQEEFKAMRRRCGGLAAAMCIIAPQADKPGAFRFHFSGHDGVVKLLQGKAGLRISETPPAASGQDPDNSAEGNASPASNAGDAMESDFAKKAREKLQGDGLQAKPHDPWDMAALHMQGLIEPHPGKPGRWICTGCAVEVFPPDYACPTPAEKCRHKKPPIQ